MHLHHCVRCCLITTLVTGEHVDADTTRAGDELVEEELFNINSIVAFREREYR